MRSPVFSIILPVGENPGHHVPAGQGARSLGTIQPSRVLGAAYEEEEGAYKYRLGFVDAALFDKVVDPAKMVRPYVADSK